MPHNRKISNHLVDHVVEMCRLLPPGGFSSLQSFKHAFRIQRDSKIASANELLGKVRSELFADFHLRFSLEYINRKIQAIVNEYSGEEIGKDQKKAIRDSITDVQKEFLDWSQGQTIYVPVYGVHVAPNKAKVVLGNFVFWRQKPLARHLRKCFCQSQHLPIHRHVLNISLEDLERSEIWCEEATEATCPEATCLSRSLGTTRLPSRGYDGSAHFGNRAGCFTILYVPPFQGLPLF